MATTTIDRLNGINSGVAIKAPCRAATTAAITLSGQQTIDGIALVAGDRVLVKNQASSIDNGIYEVSTSGWQRTPDFDGSNDVVTGTTVYVNFGTTNANTAWMVSTTGAILPGTSACAWVQSGNLTQASAFIQTLLNDPDAATARTTLGAASSGANSDITSVTGLTTQLSYPQDFRLSLTSGLPVTTADVTAATTIYAVPKTGGKIALYNGTNWVVRESAQFSLALGTLISGRPYDVFCYDNAGVPTLEALAWTNDTTRATALAYTDGVLRKNGDGTRRYLGTFYTTSTTTTEDSLANRYLYNYYHRVQRPMYRAESTASWAYTTATIRQANNSTSNRLNFVIGVAEDAVTASLKTTADNTIVGTEIQSGIGLDSTSSFSASANTEDLTKVANSRSAFHSRYSEIPAAGRHFLSWNEYSAAAGVTTWYGNNNRSQLIGTVFA